MNTRIFVEEKKLYLARISFGDFRNLAPIAPNFLRAKISPIKVFKTIPNIKGAGVQ